MKVFKMFEINRWMMYFLPTVIEDTKKTTNKTIKILTDR